MSLPHDTRPRRFGYLGATATIVGAALLGVAFVWLAWTLAVVSVVLALAACRPADRRPRPRPPIS